VQVAVACVRVVERAVDVVVHVVAVRDLRMSGARMRPFARAFDRRAGARPPAVDAEAVLVGVAFVRRMQVAVVQVVRVVPVAHRLVPAVLPVVVGVGRVLVAAHARIVSRRGVRVNRGIIV
jgi:hypothetical protein